jgi:phosphohistidine phosphatase
VAGKLRIRKRRIVIDDRIYGTGVRRLLEVVSDHGKDSETLLLVGHNPGLEELLLYLVPAPVPRDETGKLMTAGAVAVLEFEESIAGKRHGAKLVKLVRPRDLKKKKPDEAPE